MIIGHSYCEKGLYVIYQAMTITDGESVLKVDSNMTREQ